MSKDKDNNEIWKPVAGYDGLYEVSSLGRVRSLATARVLRPQKAHNGYLRINLCKNGKQKKYTVHRLVCTAFHENPLGLPIINHKNEIKTDNRAENLEWCDNRYNCTYGSLADKIAEKSREVYQYTISGEFVAWYPSANEAARQTGLDCGGIAICANKKYKTYAGFQWRHEPALFLDATEMGWKNKADSKRVYQYDAQTGRFVKEWPSAMEVKRQTGWSNGSISECCNGKFHQRYGFRWFYEYRGLTLNEPAPTHTERAGLF